MGSRVRRVTERTGGDASAFLADPPGAWITGTVDEAAPQLRALQDAGVTEQTELRLDFFYESAGSTGDAQLADLLRRETDYDVQIQDGGKKGYGVTGTTQPTAVDLTTLNEWVTWMVRAGRENGNCKFDGWGAAVP